MAPDNAVNAIAKYSVKDEQNYVEIFPFVFNELHSPTYHVPNEDSFSMEVGMLPLMLLRLSSRNAMTKKCISQVSVLFSSWEIENED